MEHPVPKVASPTYPMPSLRHLEAKFPPARDRFGVGVPSSWPPTSLLLSNLLCFVISALLSVLLFVSVAPFVGLCHYLSLSTYTPLLVSLHLCFFRFNIQCEAHREVSNETSGKLTIRQDSKGLN